MNKILKITLTFACILGAAISFFHIFEGYKYVIGEAWSPIHVNIEIKKIYAHNVSILLTQNEEFYWPSPTADYGTDTENVVMYVTFPIQRFFRGFSVRVPELYAAETMGAIDNISVFIGNKLFYFPQSVIDDWQNETEEGYALFNVPGLQYMPSALVKRWTNYYGDFNLALMGICNFLLYPARYAPTYFFLLCLFFIYRKRVQTIYGIVCNKPARWKAGGLLIVLVSFAFVLRFNGYVRHSGWSDEMYSATRAGNPHFPFMATFSDPGNPPFYFILLRYWFKLFGWTEEAGTMLSVLLGTLAVPALYFFVKPYFGRKTAFLAAFFMSICAFAIGYSQEMRAYILKMFLSPVIAFVFFRMFKKLSVGNMLLYILLSIPLVNSHYYGILFIIANFVFFVFYHVLYAKNKSFEWNKFWGFFICNALIAVSFMPFFLHQVFVKKYYFDRSGIIITPEHTGILLVILVFSFCVFYFRNRIVEKRIFKNTAQITFCSYIVFVPCIIFVLAYTITQIKPMISFRYLMPINLPFFLSVCAVFVYMCAQHPKARYFCIFLIWTFALSFSETKHNGGSASIPAKGTASFKEARAYIAEDAAAHPMKKSALLDNAPQITAYYGYEVLPAYSPEQRFDTLYVFGNLFHMGEDDIYNDLRIHGIDDSNFLKIRVNDDTVVFKKTLKK
ncbi:MAG: hypothetical protein Ta2G_10690 [Termitinemataceae bacterium]|nr:MAG: hypothetical protein Ta2G_10690 [Termitinemataceae bacterium]